MLIKLPGAEDFFVNPDHIVAIMPHTEPRMPQLKSTVALVDGGVLHSSFIPSDLFNQISEAVYNRKQES